jgi:DNA-3-methyladenine glycosylase
MFDREQLLQPALEVAPLLLGAVLSRTGPEGTVAVRLTEVEAYLGEVDPGSHAFRGRGRRNAVMFGEPGHLYTYFTYGMHVCANITCSPAGTASAVLLRGGQIVEGLELARSRRATSKSDADLARGPARLCVAMGIALDDNGADLSRPPFELTQPSDSVRAEDVRSGPRTGVSGMGGSNDFPWRFWLADERTVSKYRKHTARLRHRRSAN